MMGGDSYDAWKVEKAAGNLKLVTKFPFNPSEFPGYLHIQTNKNEPVHCIGAKTYIYEI